MRVRQTEERRERERERETNRRGRLTIGNHLDGLGHAVKLLVCSRGVIAQVHDGKAGRPSRGTVDAPPYALVTLAADRVEMPLVVEHLLGGVGNLVKLGHQLLLRRIAVPHVAELTPPRALAAVALAAVRVRRTAMLALERACLGLAVRSNVAVVAVAGDVVERGAAVAVARAPVGAVVAERDVAVGSVVAASALTGVVHAGAVVAESPVALENAATGAAAGGRRGGGGGNGERREEEREHNYLCVVSM